MKSFFIFFKFILILANSKSNYIKKYNDLIEEVTGKSSSISECKNNSKKIHDGFEIRKLFKYNAIFHIDDLRKTSDDNSYKSIDGILNIIFNEELPAYFESIDEQYFCKNGYSVTIVDIMSSFKTVKYIHRVIQKITKRKRILPIGYFINKIKGILSESEGESSLSPLSPLSPISPSESENLVKLITNFENEFSPIFNNPKLAFHSIKSTFISKSDKFLTQFQNCKSKILNSIKNQSKKERIELLIDILYYRIKIASSENTDDLSFHQSIIEYYCNLLIFSFFDHIDKKNLNDLIQNFSFETVSDEIKNRFNRLIKVIKKDELYPNHCKVYQIKNEDFEIILKDFLKYKNDGYVEKAKEVFFNILNQFDSVFFNIFKLKKSDQNEIIDKELLKNECEKINRYLLEKEDDFSIETEFADPNDSDFWNKRYFSLLRDKLSLEKYKNYTENQKICIDKRYSPEAEIYYKLQDLLALLDSPEFKISESNIKRKWLILIRSKIMKNDFFDSMMVDFQLNSERIRKYHLICFIGGVSEKMNIKDDPVSFFESIKNEIKKGKMGHDEFLKISAVFLMILVFILFVIQANSNKSKNKDRIKSKNKDRIK